MGALDEVVLDSVEDPEPHGGAQELGAPVLLGLHVRLAHGSVADEFGEIVGGHFRICLSRRVLDFFVSAMVGQRRVCRKIHRREGKAPLRWESVVYGCSCCEVCIRCSGSAAPWAEDPIMLVSG